MYALHNESNISKFLHNETAVWSIPCGQFLAKCTFTDYYSYYFVCCIYLIYSNSMIFLFVCPELIEELLRAAQFGMCM